MDKLENIFELQDVLNRRIGVNMDEMNDEDRAVDSQLCSCNATRAC